MPAATNQDRAQPDPEARAAEHVNEVHVVGRLAAESTTRELPSGDLLSSFRLVVERDTAPRAGRPHLDTLECSIWTARLRRAADRWQPGDLIEVEGALRRRFWRTGPALQSRYDIEVHAARRLRPGATAAPK